MKKSATTWKKDFTILQQQESCGENNNKGEVSTLATPLTRRTHVTLTFLILTGAALLTSGILLAEYELKQAKNKRLLAYQQRKRRKR